MNVFRLEVKSQKMSYIYWSIGIATLLILGMSLFPIMQTAVIQQIIGVKLKNLSPINLAFFRGGHPFDFTNRRSFFCYNMEYINVFIAIYATWIGIQTLSKEKISGTMNYLYVQPITRNQIVIEKLLANLVIFISFIVVIGTVALIILSKMNTQSFEKIIGDIRLIIGGTLMMGITYMTMGLVASAFVENKYQTMIGMIGIIVGTFMIGGLAGSIDAFQYLIYLSPLHIAQPHRLLYGEVSKREVVIQLLIMIISVIATLKVYNKKDL